MTLNSVATSDPSPLSLIANDMQAVDRLIAQRLESSVPLVGDVATYLITAGGKRLRPALLLMVAGAIGYTHEDRHTLAAVVEFIHTATLLHDDVVDESSMRRGRPTANASFGNAASVLVGDFLYSRSFQMMVACGNMRVLDILADATNVIAEGEVLQLMNMRDPHLSQDDYLRVIRSKTSKLFEASARLPAVLMGSNLELESACAEYGQAIGTAFQVVDDVLDYEGDHTRLGKNLGDDLREGKTTLPLILAMQRGTASQKALIEQAIEQGQVEALPSILSILNDTGAIALAKEVAHEQARLAIMAANRLPQGPYQAALKTLAEQLLNRQA